TAAHFVPLLLLLGVFGLPQLAGQLLLPELAATSTSTPTLESGDLARRLTGGALLLVGMVLWPVAQGAAIFLVTGSFTGQKVSLGEALRKGLRKALSLLAFGFAYGLVVGLGLLALVVPG